MNTNNQKKHHNALSCRQVLTPIAEQINYSARQEKFPPLLKAAMGKVSLLLCLVMLLTLASCQTPAADNGQDADKTSATTAEQGISESSGSEETEPDSSDDHGQNPDDTVFTFSWQNKNIALHQPAAPIVADMGEPLNYFEAESCAFEGIDKIYTYGSIELSTVPFNGEDTISQIVLLDDTAETREGLYIGAGKDAMIAAYGNQYDVAGDGYIYTKDDTQLMFIIEDELIVAIEYIAVFD